MISFSVSLRFVFCGLISLEIVALFGLSGLWIGLCGVLPETWILLICMALQKLINLGRPDPWIAQVVL